MAWKILLREKSHDVTSLLKNHQCLRIVPWHNWNPYNILKALYDLGPCTPASSLDISSCKLCSSLSILQLPLGLHIGFCISLFNKLSVSCIYISAQISLSVGHLFWCCGQDWVPPQNPALSCHSLYHMFGVAGLNACLPHLAAHLGEQEPCLSCRPLHPST